MQKSPFSFPLNTSRGLSLEIPPALGVVQLMLQTTPPPFMGNSSSVTHALIFSLTPEKGGLSLLPTPETVYIIT